MGQLIITSRKPQDNCRVTAGKLLGIKLGIRPALCSVAVAISPHAFYRTLNKGAGPPFSIGIFKQHPGIHGS